MGSNNKSDMDRIGLFKEMEYVTVKDPYKGAASATFNESAYKSKQMMTKCSKQRTTGSLAGYFDQQYKLLPGSYIDPISMRRRARIEEKKKNITNKPFVTMFRPKDPEGAGSFYGTIGGPIKDTDPTKAKYREQVKPPTEKANFKVNPPKKGTGYGYPNVCLDKDPPYAYKDKTDNYEASMESQRKDYAHHKSIMKAGVFKLNMHPKEYFNGNPYRDDGKGAKHRRDQADRSKSAPSDRKVFKYSSPGKSLGGNKDGCFDKFPKRNDKDPFVVGSIYSQVKNEVNKTGKTYYPNKFTKSRPTDSVIQRNVNLRITQNNYKQALHNYQGFQVSQRRASVH